jgi:hypothetical protein
MQPSVSRAVSRGIGLLGLIGAAVIAPTAIAETSLDLYLGVSFTAGSKLDGKVGGVPAAPRSVSWGDSIEGGIRGGYWLGGLDWLGFGFDASYYRPEASLTGGGPVAGISSLHLVPMSPLLMVRAPLFASDDYARGRFQPYLAAGPSFVTSVLTSDVASGREIGFDIGVDARIGVNVLIRPSFGVFLEYRYTDVVVHNRDLLGEKIKTTLVSDHLNAGVTLRF